MEGVAVTPAGSVPIATDTCCENPLDGEATRVTACDPPGTRETVDGTTWRVKLGALLLLPPQPARATHRTMASGKIGFRRAATR